MELYDAAVAGAAPGPLTAEALRDFQCRPGQRLWLYALGKGAHPMAASAVTTLQRSLHTIVGGVIVSPEQLPTPCATVASLIGDHPLPGRHSFTAAQRIAETAAGMRSDDVAIVLLSGGATSLIAAPLRGMGEADLGQLFEQLHSAGLDIHAMNKVRKRFTRWGAGRLALALAPARTHALVVSDVPGDDPADVGSGPVTPDPTTVREVLDILTKAGLVARIAPAMREYLTSVTRGVVPETPKRSHPAFAHVSTRVIGSNKLAVDAIVARAKALSLPVEAVQAPLSGEAVRAGEAVATALLARAEAGQAGCMVWGGETTVLLSSTSMMGAVSASGASAQGGPGLPPTGGRCQELALSAARALSRSPNGSRVTLLAAGTDGRDGPTDAAGAIADAGTWGAITAAGRDPELALQRHESHGVLETCGALLRRASTGTNVMDVVIGLVE